MAPAEGGLAESTERDIERFLEDRLVEQDVPGASVAVFDGDSLLYGSGFGSRDVEENAAATPETLYHVGSVTKTITAIAVLQQVERDALALDDGIRAHVPFLNDVPGDPITVGDLLTHSSGMPADSIVERDNVADLRDLRLHVDAAADRRVVDDPPFMYYNSGYKVLGELVAAVDGRSYADYVEAEVLEPLGMDRSTFDQAALWEDDDAMTGYRREGDDRVPTENPLEFEGQPADGGLIAPVTELTRLSRCLLNDGELDGSRVLAPGAVEAMARRRSRWNETLDGDERWYGYGLVVDGFLGDRLVGHAGGVSHAQAYVGALAERGLGVALAVNVHGVRIDDLAGGVLAVAAGETPAEVVPGLALRAKLDAVTGTYEARRGPTATVEAAGGHLTVAFDERDEEVVAVPTSTDPEDYSFYGVRGNGRRDPLEFRETDDGVVLLWSRLRLDRA